MVLSLATAVSTILTIPVGRSTGRDILLGNNILGTEEGHFIMGKTSDDDVLVTIMGFFVET